jgi:hypothetical protein
MEALSKDALGVNRRLLRPRDVGVKLPRASSRRLTRHVRAGRSEQAVHAIELLTRCAAHLGAGMIAIGSETA